MGGSRAVSALPSSKPKICFMASAHAQMAKSTLLDLSAKKIGDAHEVCQTPLVCVAFDRKCQRCVHFRARACELFTCEACLSVGARVRAFVRKKNVRMPTVFNLEAGSEFFTGNDVSILHYPRFFHGSGRFCPSLSFVVSGISGPQAGADNM